ncbi:MAG: hypothetical protein ACOX7U_06895 [Desulfitobacteriia bacterium]|jgi:hypothetical protein
MMSVKVYRYKNIDKNLSKFDLEKAKDILMLNKAVFSLKVSDLTETGGENI